MTSNGLFGRNSGTIKDLIINTGEITGKSLVGGIAGANNGYIINCGNKINITANRTYAGGICGVAEGSIKGCFNIGEITAHGGETSECDAGGIAGSAGVNNKKVEIVLILD